MTKVEKIAVVKKHAEVSCCCCFSGGYEPLPVEAVYFNDENFIFYRGSLVDDDGGVVVICAQCLIGCESRKIPIRQSGERIFLILSEFSGPIWCMSVEQYKQLQAIDADFPSIDAIKPLTKQDCAHIFSYELPEIIDYLGRLDDLYLNTDVPEGKGIITILKTMIADYEKSQEPVTLKKVSENNEVTIILDTPDYFEWKPLCKANKGYGLCLNLGDQLVEVL